MRNTGKSNHRSDYHSTSGLRVMVKLLVTAGVEWWNDNTSRYAAALAFYTLFSIGPVVLLSVGIAGFFFVPDLAIRNIEIRVQELVGWQAALAVKQVIDESSNLGRSPVAVIAGGVTFFLGASVMFGELQTALNTIWDVRPNRREGMLTKALADRLRSFGIALVAGLLLVASLGISALVNAAQTYTTNRTPWFWQCVNGGISLAVLILLFAMIYKYLPDVHLAWRDVWMGATVTAVLFIAGKFVIGIYLGHAALAGTFGAAGSLAVLLVWVYYSALICFFGAEFTYVFAKHRGKQIQPGHHAVRAGKKKAAS